MDYSSSDEDAPNMFQVPDNNNQSQQFNQYSYNAQKQQPHNHQISKQPYHSSIPNDYKPQKQKLQNHQEPQQSYHLSSNDYRAHKPQNRYSSFTDYNAKKPRKYRKIKSDQQSLPFSPSVSPRSSIADNFNFNENNPEEEKQEQMNEFSHNSQNTSTIVNIIHCKPYQQSIIIPHDQFKQLSINPQHQLQEQSLIADAKEKYQIEAKFVTLITKKIGIGRNYKCVGRNLNTLSKMINYPYTIIRSKYVYYPIKNGQYAFEEPPIRLQQINTQQNRKQMNEDFRNMQEMMDINDEIYTENIKTEFNWITNMKRIIDKKIEPGSPQKLIINEILIPLFILKIKNFNIFTINIFKKDLAKKKDVSNEFIKTYIKNDLWFIDKFQNTTLLFENL